MVVHRQNSHARVLKILNRHPRLGLKPCASVPASGFPFHHVPAAGLGVSFSVVAEMCVLGFLLCFLVGLLHWLPQNWL